MGKEIEIQNRGEVEIVQNREAKIEAKERQEELEKMILKLQKRLDKLEGEE